MKFYKIKNQKKGEEISAWDASNLRSNEYIKINICEKCKKETGVLYLDKVRKEWLCEVCTYPKENNKK